jgi:hypothetical protein
MEYNNIDAFFYNFFIPSDEFIRLIIFKLYNFQKNDTINHFFSGKKTLW